MPGTRRRPIRVRDADAAARSGLAFLFARVIAFGLPTASTESLLVRFSSVPTNSVSHNSLAAGAGGRRATRDATRRVASRRARGSTTNQRTCSPNARF